ncbi:hypothetical protein MPNT_260004 [Candidatus Methylacidithermus pantelleriae]|uniref:Lipoprotein n=1 Tax=Candidatus Methylacidithermus pantelleriae TaxID=2744239 RepID=A0A8J2BT29_9BACT|nr:hypothetical protein MPNT_260004 [Candidatus Methylacidithermus pantelleriae]
MRKFLSFVAGVVGVWLAGCILTGCATGGSPPVGRETSSSRVPPGTFQNIDTGPVHGGY